MICWVATTTFNTYIDNVEIRIKSGDNATANFKSVFADYDLSGNIIGEGDVVKRSRIWFNGVLGIDSDGDDVRDTLVETVQVNPTSVGAASDWEQVTQWQSEVFGFTDSYHDLAKLNGDIRLSESENPGLMLSGEIAEIVPPETALSYNDDTYVQTYTQIDLRQEITKFVAVRKQATYGFPDPTIYFSMIDSGGSIQYEGTGIYSMRQDLDSSSLSRIATFTDAQIPVKMVPVNANRELWYVRADDETRLYKLSIGSPGLSTLVYTTSTGADIKMLFVDETEQVVYVGTQDLVTTANNDFIVLNYDGTTKRSFGAINRLRGAVLASSSELLEWLPNEFIQLQEASTSTGAFAQNVYRSTSSFSLTGMVYEPGTNTIASIADNGFTTQIWTIGHTGSLTTDTETVIFNKGNDLLDIYWASSDSKIYAANTSGSGNSDRAAFRINIDGTSEEGYTNKQRGFCVFNLRIRT